MEERREEAWWAPLARHPVLTSVFAGCTLAGALLGPTLLSDEWSLLRRIAAGAVAGFGTGLLITATKLFD
jgi:hypothetical protein